MNRELHESEYTGTEVDQLLGRVKRISEELIQIQKAIQSSADTQEEMQSGIEDITKRLTNSILHKDVTQAEYDALKEQKKLEPMWYFVFQDYKKYRLTRIYYYGLLVGQRGQTASSGFPYTFPFTFV